METNPKCAWLANGCEPCKLDSPHGMQCVPCREVAFSQIVKSFISAHDGRDRVLADAFEATLSAVHGWADGTVVPRLMLPIKQWIERQQAIAQ